MALIDADGARAAIWAAVGEATPVLVESGASPDAQLALAGATSLLGALARVPARDLGSTRGEVALFAPGTALTRPADPLLARLLAVAADRFDRVIVLPGSVALDEDLTRETLGRSPNVHVFASDGVSAAGMRSSGVRVHGEVLADLAFFLDYAPHRRLGLGTLDAFREDSERCWGVPLPPDNDDVSVTAGSLADWLRRIARHRTVRTDRAYVMIAAAMLGKRVEFRADGSGRLEAIARTWLADLAVQSLPPAAAPAEGVSRSRRRWARASARVTAVVLTRNRPQLAARAIASVASSEIPISTVVIDNNSAPAAAAAVARMCAGEASIRFERSALNLGAPGGRNRGAQCSETDYLLFLDDDAELLPAAAGHLLADLEARPDAGGCAATIVNEHGVIQWAGGRMWATPGLVRFDLSGTGQSLQDPARPSTGQTGWTPSTALLVRRALVMAHPFDTGMRSYFEDNEWSWRVARHHRLSLRRCAEAVAVHRPSAKSVHEPGIRGASSAVDWLTSLACFHTRTGRLLWPWTFLVARDLMAPEGEPDLARARTVLALAAERGPDWMFAAWTSGQLAGLLDADQHR